MNSCSLKKYKEINSEEVHSGKNTVGNCKLRFLIIDISLIIKKKTITLIIFYTYVMLYPELEFQFRLFAASVPVSDLSVQ